MTTAGQQERRRSGRRPQVVVVLEGMQRLLKHSYRRGPSPENAWDEYGNAVAADSLRARTWNVPGALIRASEENRITHWRTIAAVGEALLVAGGGVPDPPDCDSQESVFAFLDDHLGRDAWKAFDDAIEFAWGMADDADADRWADGYAAGYAAARADPPPSEPSSGEPGGEEEGADESREN